MSKVTFSKLGLKTNTDTSKLIFNNQTILVKQYLPIETKLNLITEIVQESLDDVNYVNPSRAEIIFTVKTLLAYTNISITEKQSENIFKLYDAFVSSGLWKAIVSVIPQEDYEFVHQMSIDSIEAIYKYKNSVLGILESVSTDYSETNMQLDELNEKLRDPNSVAFLREVISKLS